LEFIFFLFVGKLWISDTDMSWRPEVQKDEDRTATLHARLGIGTGKRSQRNEAFVSG
jgi:hypothetical protein